MANLLKSDRIINNRYEEYTNVDYESLMEDKAQTYRLTSNIGEMGEPQNLKR